MALGVRQVVKHSLSRALAAAPDPVRVAALRRWPRLLHWSPPGTSVRWPRFLGDLVVHVDPGNQIERLMFACDYYADVMGVAHRFATSGSHCIDVGANVGAVTLGMAKWVGPGGRVLAIEPGPPYVERLLANLAANPTIRDRVTVLQAGLGDVEGTFLWKPDPDNPHNAGLSVIHDKETTVAIPVPVVTLDHAVAEQGWGRVDFVKIDVEGMELEVLRGARGILTTMRPVVYFETIEQFREFRRERSGIDLFAEIAGLMDELGYDLLDIDLDGRTIPVNLAAMPENTLAMPRGRATS